MKTHRWRLFSSLVLESVCFREARALMEGHGAGSQCAWERRNKSRVSRVFELPPNNAFLFHWWLHAGVHRGALPEKIRILTISSLSSLTAIWIDGDINGQRDRQIDETSLRFSHYNRATKCVSCPWNSPVGRATGEIVIGKKRRQGKLRALPWRWLSIRRTLSPWG